MLVSPTTCLRRMVAPPSQTGSRTLFSTPLRSPRKSCVLGGWALHSPRANPKSFEGLISSLGDPKVEGSVGRPPDLPLWKGPTPALRNALLTWEISRQLQGLPRLKTVGGRTPSPSGTSSLVWTVLTGVQALPFLPGEFWTPGARTCFQHQRPRTALGSVGPSSGSPSLRLFPTAWSALLSINQAFYAPLPSP